MARRAVHDHVGFVARPLDVEVLNVEGIFDDKVSSRLDLVAHEYLEGLLGLNGIIHANLKQGPIAGIHGGFP
mgnify:CR=1 FL=1